ncbi:helix-turn-helix transcriptional regulator [Streptomyces durbertensis]|uniref:Helix-turn-helix transcriptional regulator n=1 Tax=Streptomyces durbertensis TaxID=2448886 RepID=A0ABR6ELJ4_9ACTN|nr:helix-turn-helix transcriptional regulator [Streptomyces durbertensis]MBB1246220.1 helix-turn-helix transcriptional regulator [Streptomyces durbertensis]
MTRANRSASPTFQYCAEMVRKLREARGWSQEELGRRAGYTGAAISALETLKQPPTEVMLAKLDEAFFGSPSIFTIAGKFLALDHLPSFFKDYALIEQGALSIAAYQTVVIDALFQTEAYARALISGGYPIFTDEEREAHVHARMARTALLDRQDPIPHLELVLEESTLRRQFGSRETMRDQMLHLVKLSKRPHITVHVLPLLQGAAGEHAGVDGPMKIVERPDHSRAVYLEVQGRGLLLTRPEEVSELSRRYAMIRSHALSRYESRRVLEQAVGDWQ